MFKENDNMEKKRLYFDMDGVLVNFQSGIDKLSDETKRVFRQIGLALVERKTDLLLDEVF